MKKAYRILPLLLAAALLCVLLTSCGGGPNKDPQKAAKSLENADYTVELAGKHFAAKNCLFAYRLDPDFNADDERAWAAMEGEHVQMEHIVVYYFENANDAEAAYAAWAKAEMEGYAAEIRESCRIYNEIGAGYGISFACELGEVTLAENMIYIATSGALKDAS